jgi:hypothetical protein
VLRLCQRHSFGATKQQPQRGCQSLQQFFINTRGVELLFQNVCYNKAIPESHETKKPPEESGGFKV